MISDRTGPAQFTGKLGDLPREPVDRLNRLFTQFFRIEAAGGAILLLCAILAVVLSNSPVAERFLSTWEVPVGVRFGDVEYSRSLKHWINDGLMTLFFFVVSLELKRELAVGELRNPRLAALSLAAALGGMVVPAGSYYLLSRGGLGAHGWGTVMATDTAFVVGCLAVLGARVPLSLRLFLLSLAIFDDVGAILVVAIGYGGKLEWTALSLAALGLAATATMARLGVRNHAPYVLLGCAIWLAIDASGIHPTVAGVALGLLTPASGWVSESRLQAIVDRIRSGPRGPLWSTDTDDRQDLRRVGIATREVLSPVVQLEVALHPWVAFAILPLFALANAGVGISTAEVDGTVVAAILVGFVAGKPVGVVLFSASAVYMRWAIRPPDLSWSLLAAGGLLAGIGFTMALFIAELAFGSRLLASAKVGILGASIASGAAGLLTLAWLTPSSRAS